MTSKADYVLSQGQTRTHHCHWPGCERQVPPAMWGCRPHWFMLPKDIQTAIWRAYQPGQEVAGTPTREYVEVARRAEAFAIEFERNRPPKPAPPPATGDLFTDTPT